MNTQEIGDALDAARNILAEILDRAALKGTLPPSVLATILDADTDLQIAQVKLLVSSRPSVEKPMMGVREDQN